VSGCDTIWHNTKVVINSCLCAVDKALFIIEYFFIFFKISSYFLLFSFSLLFHYYFFTLGIKDPEGFGKKLEENVSE